MGCCEPTKMHIDNAGAVRTRNVTTQRSKDKFNNENSLRSQENANRRKGRPTGQVNQYDEILADDYRNQCGDFSLQMKDLDELPIFQVTNGYEQSNSLNSGRSASHVNPELKYTIFDSKRGKKSYESTYPKLAK